MDSILKLENFSVSSSENGKMLLDGINLEVERGEIHTILGKNGSGKTTLAYSIMGLDKYKMASGRIIFDGDDISSLRVHERARKGITLAFQEPARFEGLTVKDFLTASSKEKVDDNFKKVLELVGLEDGKFLNRKLDEKLSGGERKRIELASVILMKPKVMILDEPDASLDIIVYNELYELMTNIRKETGCAILLITHREEAGLIADRASFIHEGKLIKTGRFREVMRAYCSTMGRMDRCYAGKKLVRERVKANI